MRFTAVFSGMGGMPDISYHPPQWSAPAGTEKRLAAVREVCAAVRGACVAVRGACVAVREACAAVREACAADREACVADRGACAARLLQAPWPSGSKAAMSMMSGRKPSA